MASSSSHKLSAKHSVLDTPGKRRKVEESVRLYDVFINHRGPDVKQTLALQLYKSLEKLGIRAFLDSEEKQPGVSFSSTIKTAIESARVHIAIFSKGYGGSPWCLEELLLMLNTERKIIPLFYQVEPWELRHIEKGVYDQAFKKYEKKSRYLKNLKEWKGALERLSYVAGYVIKELPAADECKEIVSAVQKEMQRIIKLQVAKYPVGLSKLVKELESRCLRDLLQNLENQYGINEDGQGKTRIVGICGMGGTGKTTLSKELFNKYCSKYTRASFLFDVRDASTRGALPSLQLKLFKDLFEEDHPTFTSTCEGISCLQNRLGRIKYGSFLIVLDDIDALNQLDDLLVTDMLKKSGNNLIIVTTRDAGVLRRAEILNPCTLKGLDEDDARDLFCLHAFGKSSPPEEYESLVMAFVNCCGGIPLSLQILGSHVKGGDQKYWSSALRKFSESPPQEIMKKLQISFDTLEPEQQQIFMDIACFFIGNSKDMAMKIWEGSGWVAHYALETLKEKCLVQEIESKNIDGPKWVWDGICLGMHDHLRDLGREMADLCRAPRRIWKQEDLKSMESKSGFRTILKKGNSRCFHSLFDTSLGSKITFFSAGKLASLLWLQLERNFDAHPSIPSWIPLQKLQSLRISGGCLKRLWENQAPLQLKELQITKTFLEKVPDLGILSSLETVALDVEYMAIKGWSLLGSLRININTLYWNSSTLEGDLATTNSEGWTPYRSLIIRNFQQCTEAALNKSLMSGLEYVEIGYQQSVTKTLISGNHCSSIKTLKLYRMENLIEINLFRVKTLTSLHVNCCENLKMVSGISDLTKLVELNISECPELESLCLPSLYCLQSIAVDGCRKLKCLELIDCKNVKTVSGIDDLEELALLNIRDCPELVQLSAHNLCCQQRITIDGCEKLNFHAFYSLLNLKIVTVDIGRAVVRAESILNQTLFSEADIGADAVTEMDIPCPAIPEALVSKIVICGLVVVERSTPLQYIHCTSPEFRLPKGRWIVTMVVADPRNTSFIGGAIEGMCYGMLAKGFRVTLMKDQEWKTTNVLQTIDDKLYQK